MDNRYLITTSSEGCIYFWRLNDSVTKAINQRMKEFGIQSPELSTFRLPSLIMPEYEKPTTMAKVPTVVEDKSLKNLDKLTSPSKVLFSGKSPSEILMEKNRERKLEQSNQKENVKASDPYEDMTKSQIKREEVKNIVGEINNIIDGIDEIFTPGGAKSKKPISDILTSKPQAPISVNKAELDDELGVATGLVPDWAVTHTPSTVPQAPNLKAKIIQDYDQRDNIDILNQIELTNAESGISIQPEPSNRAPFTVEELEQLESSPVNKHREVIQEDDEDYNESNDPFLDQLKNITKDPKIINEFYETRHLKHDNFEEEENKVMFNDKHLRESITTKFKENKETPHSKDDKLTSYMDKRNKGKFKRHDKAPDAYSQQIEDETDIKNLSKTGFSLYFSKSFVKMVGRGQKEHPLVESSFDLLDNTNEFTEVQKDGFTSTFKKK